MTTPTIVRWTRDHSTDDYPCGARWRVSARWTVVPLRGGKETVQRTTSDPHTGRWNRPKAATGGLVAAIGVDANGHAHLFTLTDMGQVRVDPGSMASSAYLYPTDPGYDDIRAAILGARDAEDDGRPVDDDGEAPASPVGLPHHA